MDELDLKFENQDVKVIEEDGYPLFELYSTGMALGYVKSNGKSDGVHRGHNLFPRKDRIDKVLKNADIITLVHGGLNYLTESQLYDFMLEARTEKCKSFRKWVVTTVLPAIRKDGSYILGEEKIKSEDELIKLGYEAIQKKCERLEKQLTKGNIIFYKTGQTFKDAKEAELITGVDVATIRNHCRCVGGVSINDRQFGYVGAIYNGRGELWIKCENTGEVVAAAKYFDKKYSMPSGTTIDICLGKIENFNGMNFVFEEHEKDSSFYYKNNKSEN